MKVSQGAMRPPLQLETGVDLTEARAVLLTGHRGGTPIIVDPRPLYAARAGVVVHAWAPGETAQAGQLEFTVNVTWQDGSQQLLPEGGPAIVTIVAD